MNFSIILSIVQKYTASVIDSFSFTGFLKNLMVLAAAFLAPISNVMFAVLFLIFVDLITGLSASIKEKQHITSSALSRTIAKILIYLTTIIVAFVVNKYLLVGFDFPVDSIVSGFIAITEMKSIMENLNRLSHKSVLKDLILMLSNERERRLPPKKVKKDE